VPHPMIDFTARSRRLIQEAQDPKTAVILLDIVLGYGAHPDPAGAISPAILEGKRLAQKRGGHLCCVASICGTQGDPQDFRKQRKVLEKSGVVVMPTAAQAARFAAAVVQRGQVDWSAPEPVGDSSALQRTASQGQLPVKNLLDVPLGVINLGLPAFAQSLDQQGVPVIHVDWRPPAGGDPQLLEVLRKLR
jgi:FdrA protein